MPFFKAADWTFLNHGEPDPGDAGDWARWWMIVVGAILALLIEAYHEVMHG